MTSPNRVYFPKIFPGKVSEQNKRAIDWGKYNLVAYGSHSYVVVVSPELRIVQTLDEHRAHICAVKWAKMDIDHRDNQKGFQMQLASGDKGGTIIIWDVVEGNVITTLASPEQKAGVMEIQWHPTVYSVLVSLYDDGVFACWNLITCQKNWKISLPATSLGFCFNPFDLENVCAPQSTGQIVFVLDFSIDRAPTQIENKYRLANKSSGKGSNELLQMKFSETSKNLVYFLLSREILVFDLYFQQVITSIVLERQRSSFQDVLLCWDAPGLLFTIHQVFHHSSYS